MSERKYCSKCQFNQKIEKFDEGYKTCNTCRAKAKRQRENTSETAREKERATKAEYKANNPEKVKQWTQNRMNRIKDEIITCPICKYDIKKYKLKQHEQSQTHQYFMSKADDPEFEKNVPEPDKIILEDGRPFYHCNTCKDNFYPFRWAKHFTTHPRHINKS